MTPLEFIESYKQCGDFFNGKCYQFALLMQAVFTDGVAYHDCDHVIFRVRDVYYDRTGEVPKGRAVPLGGEELKMYSAPSGEVLKFCSLEKELKALRYLLLAERDTIWLSEIVHRNLINKAIEGEEVAQYLHTTFSCNYK